MLKNVLCKIFGHKIKQHSAIPEIFNPKAVYFKCVRCGLYSEDIKIVEE